MKTHDFEDYMADIHARQYEGLDDEMPEAFEEWLQELCSGEWLEYGQAYAELAVKEDQAKAQKIFESTFLND